MATRTMDRGTTARRARKMSPGARRDQLLSVAVETFAERGIDGARHAHVAARAGVAVPTVFTYFRTREALVSGVLDHVGAFLLDKVLLPTADVVDRDEAILLSGELMARFAEEHPAYAKVWLMWGTQFGEALRVRFEAFERSLIEHVTRLLDPASTPDDEALVDRARILIAAGSMLAQLTLRGSSSEQRARYTQRVATIIANI